MQKEFENISPATWHFEACWLATTVCKRHLALTAFDDLDSMISFATLPALTNIITRYNLFPAVDYRHEPGVVVISDYDTEQSGQCPNIGLPTIVALYLSWEKLYASYLVACYSTLFDDHRGHAITVIMTMRSQRMC